MEQYEYLGQSLTLPEWADFLDIHPEAFQFRVNRYGFTEAVVMPSHNWRVPRSLRIDPEFQQKFRGYSWFAKDGGVYRHQIVGRGKNRTTTVLYLHREILGVSGDQSQMVRFKNGNKYDCRSVNLELVPMGKHVRTNMPPPTGCTWRESRRRWESYISHEGRRFYLGSSKDKNVVIAAYQEAIERINKGLSPKA